MDGDAPVDPRVVRIVERVRADLDETVGRSATRTWAEVPAYPASPDPSLPVDLRSHIRAVFEGVLVSMAEGRRPTRDDFATSESQARRRVRQGLTLADFMQGFLIGQETLWASIVAAANPEAESREAALDLALHVMYAIEVGSSLAADTFLDAQALELAEGDRVARDLVEDLLAGRELTPGPQADLAAVSDLAGGLRLMVVVAEPATPLRDGQSLREVLTTFRSVLGTGRRGITVIRQDHIVGVTPVVGDASCEGDGETVAGLRKAHRGLSRRGIHLAVGASTVHDDLAAVPEAHREALLARAGLRGRSGVRALASLTPLDYLVESHDDTARRLISPRVRAFVEDDAAQGGTQVETLRAYADGDLNAKVAAGRLHVHVNTVYHRLDAIAERTGHDVRCFGDLQDLLVAVRLLSR